MQNETANTAFLKFGNVFKDFNEDLKNTLICQEQRILPQQSHSHFLSFSCDVYLEVQSGIGILLVSSNPNTSPIEEFGMNHRIRIKPNVYFGFVSTTPELVIQLYTESDYQMDAVTLSTPYEYHPVLPRIRLQNILGYYYRIRTPGYRFKGEKHGFFELTYVDTGVLYTEVDGAAYTLGEKELMIYGPGQFHTQHTENHGVSYVTIMFNMENISPDLPVNWYSVLTNRVFPYSKKIYKLIKTLVQESSSGAPYMDSLMHCLLTETIIRLLQDVYTAPVIQAPSVIRQNYQ